MPQIEYYRQCFLVKDLGKGRQETTFTWLPEKYAVKNKKLTLLNKTNHKWEEGWIVKQVYGKERADKVEAWERGWTKQREQSDV